MNFYKFFNSPQCYRFYRKLVVDFQVFCYFRALSPIVVILLLVTIRSGDEGCFDWLGMALLEMDCVAAKG